MAKLGLVLPVFRVSLLIKMAATLASLLDNDSEYKKAFQVFLESSTEHKSVKAFLNGPLPAILASIGEGKTTFNMMGVGSGTGELDLEILRQLQLQHPGAKVDNEVVEPSSDMLDKYKDLVLKTPDLDHVTFTWNNMKTSELEKDWNERNPEKKLDFIHMIQMLYYLEDPGAAVLFFRSLLQKNGKLLIVLVAGDSGFINLWDAYGTHFGKCHLNQGISVEDMKRFLDARGITYQKYKIPAYVDITRCFTPGDEKGQRLLDLLTEVREFTQGFHAQSSVFCTITCTQSGVFCTIACTQSGVFCTIACTQSSVFCTIACSQNSVFCTIACTQSSVFCTIACTQSSVFCTNQGVFLLAVQMRQYRHKLKMATSLPSLADKYPEYMKSFQQYLDSSFEHQCMTAFIQAPLQNVLSSIREGKTALNVMGVGSGSGEIDLEILRQLQLQHPGAKVDNEVVEPSSDMLQKYKDLVAKTPDLDHVTFTWNNMKTSEFEKDWKERNPEKKMDFIHMIQMLYYVEDPEATLLFFRSLLRKNGKLLLIVLSGEGVWTKLWDTYGDQFCKNGMNQYLTAKDIKTFLDSRGIPYQTFCLPSYIDITNCFTPGDKKGELLLDNLTEVQNFSKNASPELRAGVLDLLRGPDCSQEVDGRIKISNNLEALLLGP
ncbi:hypothetical protein P4O66_015076 [Electrophorus voltai]|uniref:Histamine N-methyltransferase n=1 Tax=Electrophorus voltai TaxID=2609070 RepID=A0AAD8Z0C6_9TELE|nr:hypothetical protein P4O66_015076 [Electrophorus voltai]